MFSWIERVLPQPPSTPQKIGAEEEAKSDLEPAPAEPEMKEDQPVRREEPEQAPKEPSGCTEMPPQCRNLEVPQETVELLPTSDSARVPLAPGNSASGWVLTLMTKGLQRVVPQPPQALIVQNMESNTSVPDQAGAQTLRNEETLGPGLAPNDNIDNQDKGTGKRVIKWLVQGLDKVLPQPPPQLLKISEAACTGLGETTEESVAAPPEAQPEPQAKETELPPESCAPMPSPPKPEEPPTNQESQPDTLAASCLPPAGDHARLMGWVKRRLEMVIPQPVPRVKVVQELEAPTECPIQNISIIPRAQVELDLIVEDVDPNWEKEESKQEGSPTSCGDSVGKEAPLVSEFKEEAAGEMIRELPRIQEEKLEEVLEEGNGEEEGNGDEEGEEEENESE